MEAMREGVAMEERNMREVMDVWERLCSSQLFMQQVESLSSQEVVGCMGDEEEAIRYKAEGASKFAQARFEAAASCFTEALANVSELTEEGKHLASLLYSNRAACHLKLRAWQHAISDASASIMCDANNVKSYHRRALAYRQLARFSDAVKDILTAQARLADKDQLHGQVKNELQGILRLLSEESKGLQDPPPNARTSSTDGEGGERIDRWRSPAARVARARGRGRDLIAGPSHACHAL
eukprot:768706-Hanusia_phi.AAC.1